MARAAGVSQPAVQKAVKLLIENGYVTTDGMHIRLTDSGKKYASEVYERHCTIRAFLASLASPKATPTPTPARWSTSFPPKLTK